MVALVALLSHLPTALGQQPGTVNIRPRMARAQPGLPTVNVTVDRHRVPLGEEVTFALSPASVVLNPQYIVTLDFGDKKQTQERKTKIVHLYRSPGDYRYFISVRLAGKTPGQKVPDVFLFATPTAVTINQTVNFSTQLSDNYPNIKYRFVFADGSKTLWQNESYTKHEYALPKTYLAFVDIGAPAAGGVVERIGGSERVAIQVTSSDRQQQLSVNLSAKPVKIEERQVVSFSARLSVNESNVRYRFVFGDKSAATDWQVSPQTKHRYLVAGDFSARVEVRAQNNRSGAQIVSSSSLLIEVKAAATPVVNLTASPATVMENLPVFFRARVDSPNSNLSYRFNFGDGSSPTAWSGKSFETHAYSRAGNYAPFVEIARTGVKPINAIASSARQVTVSALSRTEDTGPSPSPSPGTPSPSPDILSPSPATPSPTSDTSSPSPGTPSPSPTGTTTPNIGVISPSPDGSTPGKTPDGLPGPSNKWWIYLLIALVVFAGYQTLKWLIAPRPTFHPRADPGVSEVGADKPLSIDFQMQLNPDIAAGEYGVETPEGSLIKSERKSDD